MSVVVYPRNRQTTGRKHLIAEVSWEEEDTKVIPAETMAMARAADGDDTVPTEMLLAMPRVRTRPMGSRQHRVDVEIK